MISLIQRYKGRTCYTVGMTRRRKNTQEKAASSPLLAEIKRNTIIVTVFLLGVLLVVGWKNMLMPHLSATFQNTPYLQEVNNLLLMVGVLAVICLLLITVIVLILWKIRSLSKKVEAWEVHIKVSTSRPPGPPGPGIQNIKDEE